MSETAPGDSGNPGLSPTRATSRKSSSQIALPCSDSLEIPSSQAAKREPGQATLSILGDVSVVASETLSRVAEPSRTARWIPNLGFFFFAYLSSACVALYAFKMAPWIRVFMAPLYPVLLATLAFWWRQSWKLQAQERRFKLKVWQDALGSLLHETVSALNAIRANLIALRVSNPQIAAREHLQGVESACTRIAAAVKRSQDLKG